MELSNQKEVSMLSKLNKITFLGGGNITSAMVSGLVRVVAPNKITVVDRNQGKLDELERKYKIRGDLNINSAVEGSDSIILCVKPQDMQKLGDKVQSSLAKKSPLVISVAAGIQLESLSRWFGSHLPIVRAMPNTPSQVGEGMTLLYPNEFITRDQKTASEGLMRSMGKVAWLTQESDMDPGVATSGSGPAYVFLMMEHMIESAVAMGLTPELAQTLVLQTFYGASKLAIESDISPSELHKKVTSKGGTTAAALNVFNDENLYYTIRKGMQAAANRNAELGKQLDDQLGAEEQSHPFYANLSISKGL